jgi:hypothetical protein
MDACNKIEAADFTFVPSALNSSCTSSLQYIRALLQLYLSYRQLHSDIRQPRSSVSTCQISTQDIFALREHVISQRQIRQHQQNAFLSNSLAVFISGPIDILRPP